MQQNYKFKLDQNQIKNEVEQSNAIVKQHEIQQPQPALYKTVMPQEPVSQIIKPTNNPLIEDRHLSIRRKPPSEFANSYDWSEIIDKDDFFAAPVTNFPHAGLKVRKVFILIIIHNFK